jgi:sec-independent protein translocase protein TatA
VFLLLELAGLVRKTCASTLPTSFALEVSMDAAVTPMLVPAILDFGSGIHWIIVLIVALLLFGRRLPEIMRGLGGSIREFKKGIDEGHPEGHTPDGATSRQANLPPATPPAAQPYSNKATESAPNDSHKSN